MESTVKPPLVDTYILNGQRLYDLNLDVTKEGDIYRWEQIQIPFSKFNYAGIVDTLIVFKYPNDKMQAVVNNYLLDPTDQQSLNEFNQMQEWRKYAKELAKEILTYELY